jgi:hypothetical protein
MSRSTPWMSQLLPHSSFTSSRSATIAFFLDLQERRAREAQMRMGGGEDKVKWTHTCGFGETTTGLLGRHMSTQQGHTDASRHRRRGRHHAQHLRTLRRGRRRGQPLRVGRILTGRAPCTLHRWHRPHHAPAETP